MDYPTPTVLRWEYTSMDYSDRCCFLCFGRLCSMHLHADKPAYFKDHYGGKHSARHCCMGCRNLLEGVRFIDFYGSPYPVIEVDSI
jgi:hypothetical protein